MFVIDSVTQITHTCFHRYCARLWMDDCWDSHKHMYICIQDSCVGWGMADCLNSHLIIVSHPIYGKCMTEGGKI